MLVCMHCAGASTCAREIVSSRVGVKTLRRPRVPLGAPSRSCLYSPAARRQHLHAPMCPFSGHAWHKS